MVAAQTAFDIACTDELKQILAAAAVKVSIKLELWQIAKIELLLLGADYIWIVDSESATSII